MYLEIDFNSDEAFYVQLYHQIIIGIATSRLQEGDTLPSVRQLADEVGINMHTVNLFPVEAGGLYPAGQKIWCSDRSGCR